MKALCWSWSLGIGMTEEHWMEPVQYILVLFIAFLGKKLI